MKKEHHVIYGPPGTGKSTEIIRRLKEYIKNEIEPDRIGLCSYTKAAAQVLKEKAGVKLKYIGTIHSIAYEQAGLSNARIINSADLNEFAELTGIPVKVTDSDESDFNENEDGDLYMSAYVYHVNTQSKDLTEAYTKLGSPGAYSEFKFFIKAYEKFKTVKGKLDFNDILLYALNSPIPDLDVLFVDEAQDLSNLQWRLINYWLTKIPVCHVCGDDDQAIYEWNGANPQGMHHFESLHSASKTVLNVSHRLPVSVFKKANSILKYVENRVTKDYTPRKEKGKVDIHPDLSFIQDLDPMKSTLILYRNHYLRSEVESELIQNGIPYFTDNGKPGMLQNWFYRNILIYNKFKEPSATFSKKEKKRLISALDCKYSKMYEKNDLSFAILHWEKVLNIPDHYVEYYLELENKGLLYIEDIPIHLSSIHGSKGKEAERVILINTVSDKIMDGIDSGDVVSSEARVFYVALTRASETLDIVDSGLYLEWF